MTAGPDLHGFGRVSCINLYGFGILIHLENATRRGHGQAGQLNRYLEDELP
jgi:hypothetical protein